MAVSLKVLSGALLVEKFGYYQFGTSKLIFYKSANVFEAPNKITRLKNFGYQCDLCPIFLFFPYSTWDDPGSKGIRQWPIKLHNVRPQWWYTKKFLYITISGWNVGHSTYWTNQSKFNKSPQSCQASDWGDVIIKLWGLVR